MKVARIAVLGVALVAGFLAWRMAGSIGSGREERTIVRQEVETDQVLVASRDITPGTALKAGDFSWESWPRDSISDAFMTRSADPKAAEDLDGAIARTSFFPGEPIRASKLVRAGAGGYLSAVLPSGMRAVATRISTQTAAGGFILPNDHVDVVVTQRVGNNDNYVSETVLENIRVLAIDQTVEEKDGRMDVVGEVATLELRPEQVEQLAYAQRAGDISLALRSILDGPGSAPAPVRGLPVRQGVVSVVKFGIPVQAKTN